ncbi:MAG: protein kinase [Candidatus Melainabacteria bacterium]|nr:protein kinase [Candidatus Melainabacteria bacterium]
MKSRVRAFFNNNNRFRYIGEIGSGGAGEVIKAEDLSLNKIVAIKILSSHYTEKAGMRLQKEATAAGSLSHPNITKIMDFALTPDGTPYLVMEYIDGITLAAQLEQTNRLEPEDAVPIFIQLAQALIYAHQRGITHRDLKPSNVMLTRDEKDHMQVKLLDFGLAKKQTDSQYFTTTGAIAGSPLYMSPEQAEGKKIEPNSDIYSFGCLMFETLAGQPPYRGETVLQTLSMHKSRDIKIPYLDTILSDTPCNHELARLVFSCMQKEKEDRPDALQVLKDLNRIAKGEIEHKPEDLVIPTKKPAHLKTLVLVMLILLPTLLVIFEFARKPEKTASPQTAPEANFKEEETSSVALEKFKTLEVAPLTIQANPDAKITDADFSRFEGKKIDVLRLSLIGISGTGFKYLKNSNLTHLVISEVPLTEEGMRYLSQIKTLKSLEFISLDVSSNGLEHLKELRNLETLHLNCPKISEQNLCSIATLPNVANLEITGAIISSKGLIHLCAMKSLHTLALLNCTITSDAVGLAPGHNLTELDFNQSTGINSKIYEAFRKSNISILGLENQIFGPDEFRAIAMIPKLSHMNLSATTFKPKDLELLVPAANLRSLKLNRLQETPDSLFDAVKKLKLLALHFDETPITEKQLFSILKMKTLQEIHLESCENISTRACEEFQKSFKSIWKHDCHIVLSSQAPT